MMPKNKTKVPAVKTTPEEVKPIDNNLRKWDLTLNISFGVMVVSFCLMSFFLIASFIVIFYIIAIIFILSLFSTLILSIINLIKGNRKAFVITALVLSLFAIAVSLYFVLSFLAFLHGGPLASSFMIG